jgi:RsiW-degrading membrane proteinase PrsW (M82 family)
MDLAMKILIGIAIVMMLFAMWPAYKHWSTNSPKAEKGDWANVVFILGVVVLFVALLIMSVQ